MRYVSFVRPGDGTASFGRLHDDSIVDLGAAAPDLATALARGTLAAAAGGARYARAGVALLPVIPNPGKIICVGLNYQSHRLETGRAEAAHPAIFTRWADTLVGHGAPLVRPAVSTEFDYEGELAVVIGRGGRNIAAADAPAHLAGYTIFNDASVRDWQRHTIQFTPGKNFPGTGALGPALITGDEIDDLGALRVTTRVNGRTVQDQPVSDMIWTVAEIVAYCSTFTMLAAGDVIATGTPGGVGAKRTPPLWLKPGDVVEVEIGTLGVLSNPVVGEA